MATTTDGTQIAQDLAITRENIDRATNERRAMAAHLIERGASGISSDSTIAAVGKAACDLVDALARGELSTVISFYINPTGSEHYTPTDPATLAAALNGAHVRVEEVGTNNVWRIPIYSLDDTRVAMDNTFTNPVTNLLCTVVLGSSGEDIRGRRTAAVVANASSVTVTLTTYLADEETFEIGRVFPVNPSDPSSYLITATTAGGVRTEAFGHFDTAGVWISETGVQAAVPEIDPETGEVASWTNGSDGRNDFERNVFPYNKVKRETFVVTAANGVETPLEMSGFRPDAFYGVKVETRDMAFETLQTDGTFVTTYKQCRILWVAKPDLPGYELSSCFYRKRWVDNGVGGLALEMELSNGVFMGAHKGNTTSLVFNKDGGGTETLNVLNSGNIGSTNSGSSVADFVTLAGRLNRLSVTDPTLTDALEPDATGCRFACTNLDSYMAFWYLFVIQFGADAQKIFNGITTDSGVAQTKAGVTDAVIDAGYMTGSVGNASEHTPFVYLGVENFGYGSEGDTLADVSYFSGRDSDYLEDGTTAAPFETKIFVQIDRSRYTPNNNSIESITANGYQLLTTRDSGNNIANLCGRSSNPALRDLHMPCKSDDGFISAKNCDTGGHGIYRNGQATGVWVLSNATLFGYRNAGHGGGSRGGVCAVGWIHSHYAPGSSYATYFGSRVTMVL